VASPATPTNQLQVLAQSSFTAGFFTWQYGSSKRSKTHYLRYLFHAHAKFLSTRIPGLED
jgi:hypothetical protein